MPPIRTSEPDGFLITLPDPAWVECPRCGKPARVVRKPHRYRWGATANLTCPHCTYRHEDAELFRTLNSKQFRPESWHPRCAKCGGDKFDFSDATISRHAQTIMLKTRCLGCGASNAFPARGAGVRIRDGHDHWFGLPLVLRASYGKRLIWAYNVHHIDLLERWIEADLRERSLSIHRMTMTARLPRWMKAAHARRPVLRALAKMRAQAQREGLV